MESHTEERCHAGERWLGLTLQPVSSNTLVTAHGAVCWAAFGWAVAAASTGQPMQALDALPCLLLCWRKQPGKKQLGSLFELTVGRTWQPCDGGRSSELLVTLNLETRKVRRTDAQAQLTHGLPFSPGSRAKTEGTGRSWLSLPRLT